MSEKWKYFSVQCCHISDKSIIFGRLLESVSSSWKERSVYIKMIVESWWNWWETEVNREKNVSRCQETE